MTSGIVAHTIQMPTFVLGAEEMSDKIDWYGILNKASERALGGGASGAAAGIVQVLSLMWLRTAMNYQYRYGGDGMIKTIAKLYDEGGIGRLYKGVGFALVQSPLSRFGDAAANAAVPQLIIAIAQANNVPTPPLPARQAVASAAGAVWRIFLTPIDTLKTSSQVGGGLDSLKIKLKNSGDNLLILYNGALTGAAATWIGSYPWFLTYNTLDGFFPLDSIHATLLDTLIHRATLGVCASSVSDICSNSLRVIKTGIQTSDDPQANALSIAKQIIDEDGFTGLLGRGLQTRLAVNAIQGAVFSIAWKYFESILLVSNS
eukprot:CAMPEP_0197318044 /NCGR_PEP_ID=MMETSP0891-20130614/49307_1 /TAXON_ID=44058 ORGANISM="Aureoumbra lagunensis, Strain CCMP1510" /NCGR_SAMPLE_ID=MMETSP0891 /ASSEMBLY_ACC=CAM_ASM_000534 /LENGTH=316 /DNA_ID=CAMNT_0042808297 /DNA_START=89 /DNA_END=1039 /DNA_ORIENTATION=+